ncbi:biotin synthase BioB [Peptoclostridium acidaminophilum DSM 3953]|uniref:Biotin synthase n=1 Tax=Peptoclostridium acidaminophilum DSM 3953 TaxID=1286171 RepID=W8T3G6_PEPAC|nr:biotin synthase BioB [Peptoclostridium acidaminophilum]AHM56309.1 biotin synthase BioB [Peptoclostridium acidaminophilum DSM 3953]
MMQFIREMESKSVSGEKITRDEALRLFEAADSSAELLQDLLEAARRVKESSFKNSVELCSIINAKSGRCSEDCSYCSQSAHYATGSDEYGLLSYDEILENARQVESKGVRKFSLVTSGRGIQSDEELNALASIYKRLSKDTGLMLCASHGIIDLQQARALREAGVSTYHHNLETSRSNYGSICTTHSYDERLDTIRAAQEAGLQVCCGGIIGLGETRLDRIDMAIEAAALGIKSVPVNILMPVKGTPLENSPRLTKDEILKTLAVMKLMLPQAHVRLAGGRMLLGDLQGEAFRSCASAAIVGDYLTSVGSNIQEDKRLLLRLGLEAASN